MVIYNKLGYVLQKKPLSSAIEVLCKADPRRRVASGD
jgi:hypothetical protein